MADDDLDYTGTIRNIYGSGPASRVAANADINPDDSARAYQLEKVTGVPASIIGGDLDGFERNTKIAASNVIVGRNQYISDFVQRHPLNSQIFNDSYGELDTLSQGLTGLQKLHKAIAPWDSGEDPLKHFTEGGRIGSWQGEDFIKDNPLAASIVGGLATPIEVLFRGISGTAETVADLAKDSTSIFGDKFSKDIGAMTEAELMGLTGRGHLPGPEGFKQAVPWLASGEVPPAGVHPAIDAIKVQHNQTALELLDQKVSEAQAVPGRERAPDLLRDFVNQHTQDSTMGISGEAALRLYGDKVPSADDGILGWVPNLKEQLEVARDTGADITVPMADWIAKVDPQVHKVLHDDLRVVPEGITTKEAENLKSAPPPIPTVDETIPVVRAANGMEPMFAVGDRKLGLKRLVSESNNKFGTKQDFHDFMMVNENGQSVGTINLSLQNEGKDLYIEMINGIGEYYDPNNFGPALIRSILRQLKGEFPNVDYITGHRVTGARSKAGYGGLLTALPRIKLSEFELDQISTDKQFRDLTRGTWVQPYPGIDVFAKFGDQRTKVENQTINSILADADRILPRSTQVRFVDSIQRGESSSPRGLHQKFRDGRNLIMVSLASDDPAATFSHEAVHDLWDRFTSEERGVLKAASEAEGWHQRFDIDRRYADLHPAGKLEESVAEAFRTWRQEKGQRDPATFTAVDKIFEKLDQLIEMVKAHLRRVLGAEPTYQDLFGKIESGEVRDRGKQLGPDVSEPAQMVEGHLPGMAKDALETARGRTNETDILNARGRSIVYDRTLAKKSGEDIKSEEFAGIRNALTALRSRIRELGEEPKFSVPLEPGSGTEVAPPFRAAKDVAMTVPQYQRYMKLIEARQQADLAASSRRILADQTKRQTADWKAKSDAMRPEVVKDINARPDVAADKFLANSELHGKKLENSYKLNRESMTKEQAEALPNEYLTGRTGIKADDVSHLFGYQTGDQMIAALARLNETRKATGLGKERFQRHLIDMEIARRMEIEHGFLEKNILEEAKDQILSQNQLDLLYEETHQLATMAGSTFGNITRDQLISAAKDKFDALPMRAIDSDKWLREAGKHGKNAELALLNNKPADAFVSKQAQYFNTIYAQFARDVEKAKTKLDKAAKPFRKGDVRGVEPEYLNHIQNLLQTMGYKVGRSLENIQENLTRRGSTLEEFADAKLSESYGLRDIPIADVIVDGKLGPVDGLTTHDFMGAKQTIDALIKNAKDEQKIIKAGETADRKVVLDEMKDHIERFPLQPQVASKGRWDKLKELPKTFLAAVTNMETFLNRMGNRDPQSVFNRYVTYPAAAAANRKSALQREYARKYQAIGEIEDKDKLVVAPFNDPTTGQPFIRFTRGNVATMLQNAGNKGNWNALAKGYGADPAALMKWLEANTRPGDWVRAQKLGKDVFGGLVKLADQEYEHIHGITIDKIPLEPISNIHGNFEGWYHPLIKHPDIEGKSPIRDGAYDDGDFGHITTSNGYTKKRSGSAYPLDLNPDMVPVRIGQMIHDISFRSFVLETQKIFKDPGLSNTITGHYGAEYNGRNFLLPWLKAIAGQESIPSRAAAKGRQVSEFLRQNVISTYIGFNPFTAFKHGPTALVMSSRSVGTTNFLRAVQDMYARSPSLTQANHEFAMKWSEELQRRERHWQDTIFGAHSEIEGAKGVRENIIQAGSWLVAKSDMFSAKPTWLAAYREAQDKGFDHGASIDMADAKVRDAHGSTAVTNQPTLVRGGGALHNWLTSVYGFFGTVMQRRIELCQDIHDTWGLAEQGDLNAMAKNLPGIAADVFAYVIWPTLVEEWVTGLTTDDKRGWLEHAATASLLGLSSSVLYARDIVHGMLSGQDASVGLISSPLHDVVKAAKDLGRKDAFTKARMGKTVGDTLTALGHATGMAPKTIDNAIRFGIDLVNQQTHPKTFGDWARGTLKGTTKPREEK